MVVFARKKITVIIASTGDGGRLSREPWHAPDIQSSGSRLRFMHLALSRYVLRSGRPASISVCLGMEDNGLYTRNAHGS